jgi:hypothetical protein
MKSIFVALVLGLAGLIAAPVASAQKSRAETAAMTDAAIEAEATEEVAKITDVPSYLVAREKELAYAEEGGFGRIPRPDMDRLRTAYATMNRLLQGQASAQDLPIREKVELFNTQETITAILKGDAATAVHCERSRSVGSNIRSTQCVERRSRDKRREDSQDYMHRHNALDSNTCVFNC